MADNNTRIIQFKKTKIIAHFRQEVDENGVVQTTARADFLKKSPGVCVPLIVEATWNTREAALQKLIHKIHGMIKDGTLTYEEHRFCPSEGMIYITNPGSPQPAEESKTALPVVKRPLVSKPEFEGIPGQRIILLENMEDGRQPYVRLHVVQDGQDFFTAPEIDIWGHGHDRESAELVFRQKRRDALEAVEAKAREIFDLGPFTIYEYRYSDSPTLSNGSFSKDGWDAHRKTVIFAQATGHEAEFYMYKCHADDPRGFREVLTLIYNNIDRQFDPKKRFLSSDAQLKEIQSLCRAYLASCSPKGTNDKYQFEDPCPISDPKKARGIMEIILKACMTVEAPPHDPQLALDTIRHMAESSLKPPTKPEPPDPRIEILNKLLDTFKSFTDTSSTTPPSGADKKLAADLDNCVKEFTEGLKADKETLASRAERKRKQALDDDVVLDALVKLKDYGETTLQQKHRENSGSPAHEADLTRLGKLLDHIEKTFIEMTFPVFTAEGKPKVVVNEEGGIRVQPPQHALNKIRNLSMSAEGLPTRGVLEDIISLAAKGITTPDIPGPGEAVEGGPIPKFWKLLQPVMEYLDRKARAAEPKPEEHFSTPQEGAPPRPIEMSLNHIMTTIEASLEPGSRRPHAAVLDDIIHSAAQALLAVNYYDPKTAKAFDKVVKITEQRVGKATKS